MTDYDMLKQLQTSAHMIENNLSKIIIGQKEVIRDLLISVFCGGHVLLVGVPGLAKTLLVTSLAKSLNLQFKRVQFTPDLMPSDIIGTEILEENRSSGQKEFKFIKGPIFSNIILADEINRTPPKTQAALLQAMQEHEVSAGNTTYKMQDPFFVLATQNPLEQEGTYPLPEAQLDRFLFNLIVDYPSFDEETEIVKRTTGSEEINITPILTVQDILKSQNLIRRIPVTDRVVEFAVDLVRKSRPKDAKAPDFTREMVSWGAGPRASQFLILAAKASAALNGNLTPDIADVVKIAKPVLRHRISPNFRAAAEGVTSDSIIDELLKIKS